jgi:hypothetical protein
MARNKAIMAWGNEADRHRLAAIARSEQQSGSQVLLTFIQTRYRELFGDLDPSLTVPKDQ